MDVEIRMPDLATTGGAVKVLRWLVEVGGAVGRGEPLLEVETDKATVVVESVATGTLKAQAVRPDEEVEAGQVIATMDAEGTAFIPPSPPPRADPTPPPMPRMASPPPTTRPGSLFARNRAARPAEGSDGA